jgi:hypothetical protein
MKALRSAWCEVPIQPSPSLQLRHAYVFCAGIKNVVVFNFPNGVALFAQGKIAMGEPQFICAIRVTYLREY